MQITQWVLLAMEKLGLVGVALFMFLENVFPPIPSELVMPAAGFAASQGRLGLFAVIVAGTIGSLLGALPLYYFGTIFNQDRLIYLTERYGRYFLVKPQDVINAQKWFDKYGYAVIFFGRMIPAIRSLISIPAGMSRMPLLPFLGLTAVGSAIWTSFLAYLGYIFGANYEKVADYIAPVSKFVVIAVLVVVAVMAVYRIKSVFFDRT